MMNVDILKVALENNKIANLLCVLHAAVVGTMDGAVRRHRQRLLSQGGPRYVQQANLCVLRHVDGSSAVP